MTCCAGKKKTTNGKEEDGATSFRNKGSLGQTQEKKRKRRTVKKDRIKGAVNTRRKSSSVILKSLHKDQDPNKLKNTEKKKESLPEKKLNYSSRKGEGTLCTGKRTFTSCKKSS